MYLQLPLQLHEVLFSSWILPACHAGCCCRMCAHCMLLLATCAMLPVSKKARGMSVRTFLPKQAAASKGKLLF